MKTKLTYIFHKDYFDLDNTVDIEFENPPFIPKSAELIDIDFHDFFEVEIADKICNALEQNKNLLPHKTNETWKKDQVSVMYEYMDVSKKLKYKVSRV